MPRTGGVLGMSDWEEALRQTQDMVERPCLAAGLVVPQNTPQRAAGSVCQEGSLGIPA